MFAGSNRKPSTIGIGTSSATVRWAIEPGDVEQRGDAEHESSGVRSIQRR